MMLVLLGYAVRYDANVHASIMAHGEMCCKSALKSQRRVKAS